MKYPIKKIILENLAALGMMYIDAFFPSNYSYAALSRKLLRLDESRYTSRSAAKHSLSSVLHRLKKQGLVASRGPKKKMQWRITTKGKSYLKSRSRNMLENTAYDLPPRDHIMRIVSFDIPEKERRKRNWLRRELLACDYTTLHQSVFIGQRPLPHEFIKKIDELNLARCLHIASIEQPGTIRKPA